MPHFFAISISEFFSEKNQHIFEAITSLYKNDIPVDITTIKDELDKLGYDKYIMSEVTFIPDNYITLDEDASEKVMALIEALEDLDDVQNVYHNLDI